MVRGDSSPSREVLDSWAATSPTPFSRQATACARSPAARGPRLAERRFGRDHSPGCEEVRVARGARRGRRPPWCTWPERLGPERSRIHGRECRRYGERRRGGTEVGAGRARRPRVLPGRGRSEPEWGPRLYGRPAASGLLLRPLKARGRGSGSERTRPRLHDSPPKRRVRAARDRRSGTSSSPPRGASCRSSRAESHGSRWSLPGTWPGRSSARSKGGQGGDFFVAHPEFSNTGPSPRRSRPCPRGGLGSYRSPRQPSGRRALSRASFRHSQRSLRSSTPRSETSCSRVPGFAMYRTHKWRWVSHFGLDFEVGARLTWEWYLERGWILDRGGKIRVTGDTK